MRAYGTQINVSSRSGTGFSSPAREGTTRAFPHSQMRIGSAGADEAAEADDAVRGSSGCGA
ncbi:hypothetical protein GCM10023160_11790 [Brachybacterium paraconglomeratum]